MRVHRVPKPSAAPAPKDVAAVMAAPADWKPLPLKTMQYAAWQIGEGEKIVEVTIIPLGGAAGGVAANVNRWRDQLGLKALPDAEINSGLRHLEVAGKSCPYADISSDPAKPRRTLGVIIERGPTTWFVKMMGHAEIVAQQQTAFEGFVRTIRLPEDR